MFVYAYVLFCINVRYVYYIVYDTLYVLCMAMCCDIMNAMEWRGEKIVLYSYCMHKYARHIDTIYVYIGNRRNMHLNIKAS